MSLYDRFITFDDELASKGVPPLSAWWRAGLREWFDAYENGDNRALRACAGRGSAKSTALYKLALFFALFGSFVVPPGEIHFAVVLSRLKDEAGKGIAIISRWCDLLGVSHRPTGDVIEFAALSRGIRVVAASVAASSGWRAFFVGKDERSKWRTGAAEDLDEDEVDTSAAAMTATHENAVDVAFGSAWGAFGTFFEDVTGGTDATRVVLGPSPTWVCAPHISEESTHKKERDPKRWAREYACQFQGGISSAIDVEGLAACVRSLPEYVEPIAGAELVLDASGGRFDAFTAWLFQWVRVPESGPWHLMEYAVDADGKTIAVTPKRDDKGDLIADPNYQPPRAHLYARCIFHERGRICESYSTDDIARILSDSTSDERVHLAHGDQFAAWSWESDFRRHGVRYVSHNWDNPSKSEAIVRLRQMIRERTLIIEPGEHADALVDESRRFVEKILPSGLSSFGARTGHDDRVMCLLLAARVDSEAGLRGSPLRHGSTRTEVHA